MRITARSIVAPALTVLPVCVLFGCAYLAGLRDVSDASWSEVITLQRLFELPTSMIAGFTTMAVMFGVLVHRLVAYATGRPVRPLVLVLCMLALLAAMYGATYDTLGVKDLYPFLALLVVSLLLFRLETRVVAAVLFGVIVVAFFTLGSLELGERDGKRLTQTHWHGFTIHAHQNV